MNPVEPIILTPISQIYTRKIREICFSEDINLSFDQLNRIFACLKQTYRNRLSQANRFWLHEIWLHSQYWKNGGVPSEDDIKREYEEKLKTEGLGIEEEESRPLPKSKDSDEYLGRAKCVIDYHSSSNVTEKETKE